MVDLLRCHLTRARAETAPGSAHALDLAGLQAPNISLWTVWDDDKLLGIGALKQLSIDHCEIKSMYTAQFARRKGVGRTMLCHIIATARERGMSRLSLETGSWDHFSARTCAPTLLQMGLVEEVPGKADTWRAERPGWVSSFAMEFY